MQKKLDLKFTQFILVLEWIQEPKIKLCIKIVDGFSS